uniref:Uncharacterized protein n=1 Tax=Romanomermis culicivorax TaxID=13658 RepID=A0A915KCR5_ROMCU
MVCFSRLGCVRDATGMDGNANPHNQDTLDSHCLTKVDYSYKDLGVFISRHICFMQPVGNEQIEKDVFETNVNGVDDDDNNTCLVDDQTGITNKCPINQKFVFYDFETMQEKVLQQTEL